ncbi:MAG: M24 family metallopeptidase [Thermoanaerobaculia bacterium]
MKIRDCRRVVVGCAMSAMAMGMVVPNMARAGEVVEQGRRVDGPGAVLSQRQRPEPVNRALEERLVDLLPRLMREVGLDMWLVINREYAEDPVYLTLVPEPVFAARRTTMLVFHDRGDEEGIERLTVSRYPLGELYDAVWEGGDLEEQWVRLAEVIAERDPQRIGINVSRHWPVADGLTASLRDRLEESLGRDLAERLVSAEALAIRWLETRSSVEQESYPHIVALARGVISEAFSNRVITPGVTTTEDVAWYIRQRFADLDLPAWFMPDVDIQRLGTECEEGSPFCGDTDVVIQRGDILHTDVGVCYLRLCTDTQEMGYVLRQGEEEAPDELRRALEAGNRWQDLLTDEFQEGRTGNETLAAARTAAEQAGIAVSVYSHPIGFFGHAPGPTIGMWDNQGDTPVRGDWKLHADTAYAIEGNNMVQLSAWGGQWVQIKLEQSALFDGQKVQYLAGRQTDWHLVH